MNTTTTLLAMTCIFFATTALFCSIFKKIQFQKKTLKKIDYSYYALLSLTIFFFSPAIKNGTPIKNLCNEQNFASSHESIKKEWHAIATREIVQLYKEISPTKIDRQKAAIFNDFIKNPKTIDDLYNAYTDDPFIKARMRENAPLEQDMLDTYISLYNEFNTICQEVRASKAYSFEFTPNALVDRNVILGILLILIAYKVATVTSEVRGWTKES